MWANEPEMAEKWANEEDEIEESVMRIKIPHLRKIIREALLESATPDEISKLIEMWKQGIIDNDHVLVDTVKHMAKMLNVNVNLELPVWTLYFTATPEKMNERDQPVLASNMYYDQIESFVSEWNNKNMEYKTTQVDSKYLPADRSDDGKSTQLALINKSEDNFPPRIWALAVDGENYKDKHGIVRFIRQHGNLQRFNLLGGDEFSQDRNLRKQYRMPSEHAAHEEMMKRWDEGDW